MELKVRLRELRKALKLTQEKLADRAGLERVEVVNLESGRNQATAVRILRGIAKGFGLTLQDAADFVDGNLSVEEALARIRGGSAAGPAERRSVAAQLAREDGVDEAAIRSVLAEPLTGRVDRSTLWWALRMKRRELDPSPTSDEAKPAAVPKNALNRHR